MPIKIIFILFFINILSASKTDSNENKEAVSGFQNYHLLKNGEFCDFFVDRVLYKKEGSAHFYIRFIIKNKTNSTIGLLNDYWSVFPNQWRIHQKNRDIFTFERQMEPDVLDAGMKDLLDYNYRNNRLTLIPAGKVLDFYKEFGAEDRNNMDLREKEILTISFDGQLFLTKGSGNYEMIDCIDDGSVQREMSLTYPIRWQQVSDDNLIMIKPSD